MDSKDYWIFIETFSGMISCLTIVPSVLLLVWIYAVCWLCLDLNMT